MRLSVLKELNDSGEESLKNAAGIQQPVRSATVTRR